MRLWLRKSARSNQGKGIFSGKQQRPSKPIGRSAFRIRGRIRGAGIGQNRILKGAGKAKDLLRHPCTEFGFIRFVGHLCQPDAKAKMALKSGRFHAGACGKTAVMRNDAIAGRITSSKLSTTYIRQAA